MIDGGKSKMDYIYVKDVVRIAREIKKSKIENDDFILGSGKPLTQKEIAELISLGLSVKDPAFMVPK